MNVARVTVLALGLISSVACGKKGDPLPPLVRIPAAPDAFVAERRADGAELTFTVPATNTDGTRPANIERLDVYALSGPGTLTDDQLLREGTRIASLAVKAPRDADAVVDADDDAELEPLVGTGLDQGVTAHVHESVAGFLSSASGGESRTRQYLAVGITTRGRRGLFSKRAAVSLVAAPAAPPRPEVNYDEKQLTVSWPERAPLTFNVYEVVSSPSPAKETRLTPTPLPAATFGDARIEWGTERCYVVRAVEVRDGMAVESAASPSSCVTLTDRFAPAVPVGLTAVGADGAVSLTWDASVEADLAGYVVLRGATPADALVPLTQTPIVETTFKDAVPSGTRGFYAVQAVDKTGNRSEPSARVDATAR